MKSPAQYFRAGVGAAIVNRGGLVLALERADIPGAWQLPQGGLKASESPLQAVFREVKEETGLLKVKAGRKICSTYHTYQEFGKRILKETEWFDMKSNSQQELIPRIEEGIQKVEWVNESNLSERLRNAYPLIADVVISAGIDIKI